MRHEIQRSYAGRSSSAVALLAIGLCALLPLCARGLDCGPEVFIAGDDEYNDKGPSIDVDPSGTAWLVWTGYDSDEGDEDIFCSRNDGSGWTTQEALHAANASADRYPEISIGADGVPWVIWYCAGSGGERLLCSHWARGGWTEPDTVRTGADRYDDYDICAVNTNDVWVATDGSAEGVSGQGVLVYHWDGVEWSEAWRYGFDMPGHSCMFPDVAVDPSGAPWVVFSLVPDLGHSPPIIFTHLTEFGWAAADTANADLNNCEGTEIVFDGDVPMIVWTGNMAASVEVEYSRLEDGAWTPSQLVNLPDSTGADYDYITECTAGPRGEIFVTWSAGNYHDFFSKSTLASYWTGTSWAPEQVIGGSGDNKRAAYSTAGVGPDGNLWSAWVCYEEIAPPWDEDIRGTTCSLTTTPVDFGVLEGAPFGSSVQLRWYAAGEATNGPFHVWRAFAGELGGLPDEPPGSAICLNDDPVAAAPYRWNDSTAPAGTDLLFWIEWARPGRSLYAGPVSVRTFALDTSTPARLAFVSPNPSSGGACIGYEQSIEGAVSAVVYNVTGQRVAVIPAPYRAPGTYTTSNTALCWDGVDSTGARVASGVYLVELRMNGTPVQGQRREVTILR